MLKDAPSSIQTPTCARKSLATSLFKNVFLKHFNYYHSSFQFSFSLFHKYNHFSSLLFFFFYIVIDCLPIFIFLHIHYLLLLMENWRLLIPKTSQKRAAQVFSLIIYNKMNYSILCTFIKNKAVINNLTFSFCFYSILYCDLCILLLFFWWSLVGSSIDSLLNTLNGFYFTLWWMH